MPKVNDDWDVRSDLIDDFDFEITGAEFKYDSTDAETVNLVLEGNTSDEEMPRLDEANENALRVRVGKKWVIIGDGAGIEHESGKKKPLNPNSHYGMWVAECIDALGIGNTLRERGSQRDAKVWVGLRFHVNRREQSGTIDGEKRTWSKALPSKFLGEVSGTAATVTDIASGESTPAAAAPSGDSIPEMEAKLRLQLTAVAKNSVDYKTFVTEVFGIEGVTESTDVQAWLMDESSYTALRGE